MPEEMPIITADPPSRDPDAQKKGISVQEFRRIWKLGECSWIKIISNTLLMTVCTGLTGLALIVIKGLSKESDDILGKGSIIIIVKVCGLLLAREIVTFAAEAIGSRHSMRVFENLRRKIFRHLLYIPLPVIQRKPIGEWVARCERDTSMIQSGLLSLPFVVVVAPFSIIFYLVVIYMQSMELSLVMLICALAGVLPAILLRQKMFAISRKILRRVESLTGRLGETFMQMKTVKSLCEEPERDEELVDWSETHLKLMWKSQLISIQARQLSSVIMMIAFAAVFLKGRGMVIAGDLTIARLIVVMGFVFLMVKEIRKVSGTISGIQGFAASARRYLDTLALEKEKSGPESPAELRPNVPDITFKDVSFAYDDGRMLLKNIDFSIKRGEMISIVGLSGAGKTTLYDLILGFIRPQHGSITSAGKSLDECNIYDWRKRTASVFQERAIFRGTIRENLVRTRTDVTDEEIQARLNAIFLAEAVNGRMNGLDADIFEMGSNWSEGELQRMTILRAVLEKPEILLLDEPTSALDARAEEAVISMLHENAANRITLVITHRMNLAMKADRVIVMDQDIIEGIGPPQEMQEKSDLFKYMCLAQHISNIQPYNE